VESVSESQAHRDKPGGSSGVAFLTVSSITFGYRSRSAHRKFR